MLTANQLSDWVLLVAMNRRIEDMTNLKLQKLLYYCQAWHLVFTDKELFDDRIEAWVHGPVIPSVFHRFRQYRWGTLPINEHADVPELSDASYPIKDHVESVLNAYAHLNGRELETLTHGEDPWRDARRGLPCDQPSTSEISWASMRNYYRARVTVQ